MNSSRKKTFFIKTLGCKVNQYESQKIRAELLGNGFAEAPAASGADICVINSCTVTHRADREVRRLARQYGASRGSCVVICGCMAETAEDRALISGIDGVRLLAKNSEKSGLVKELCGMFGSPYRGGQGAITEFKGYNRAFVKIQDGCDNRCSYCKVSIVRGRSRSRPEEEIVSEAGTLAEQGYKEIVLTGICAGAWGPDLKPATSLSRLLKRLSGMGGFRLRLSSIEPKYVTEELIAAAAGPGAFCRHFHIPLQSGDDSVLSAMNRGYTAKQFVSLIERIRQAIPGCSFTTDVIVGFPGEGDSNFMNTCGVIRETAPARVHAFTYSPRKGTASFAMKNAPHSAAVKARLKTLEKISKDAAAAYSGQFIGKTVQVLVE